MAGCGARGEDDPVIAILGSGAADAPFSKKEMSLLETRWAGSDAERFQALATELLADNPRAVVVVEPTETQSVAEVGF